MRFAPSASTLRVHLCEVFFKKVSLCNFLNFLGVDLGLIFRFTDNSEGSGDLGVSF